MKIKPNKIATRRTLKISGDISFSDMQQLIRDHMNMPYFILTTEQYEGIKNQAIEKEEMLRIMGDHYTQLSAKKTKKDKAKLDELLTMARFLQKLGLATTYEIETVREAPDFILKNIEQNIAVELTEILDEPIQRETNDLRKALARATSMLVERMPSFSGVVNLEILPGTLTHQGKSLQELNRVNKETVPKIIAAFIEQWFHDPSTERPAFIQHISYSSIGSLSLELSETYIVRDLNLEKIQAAVTDKESNLPVYLSATGLDKCWLLLVLKGAGEAAGYRLDNIQLSQNSKFDRVYLLEAFGGTVLQLK